MQALLNRIAHADALEMDVLLTAICRRYEVLFPSQELHILTVRKEDSRDAQLDHVIGLLQRMKDIPG